MLTLLPVSVRLCRIVPGGVDGPSLFKLGCANAAAVWAEDLETDLRNPTLYVRGLPLLGRRHLSRALSSQVLTERGPTLSW